MVVSWFIILDHMFHFKNLAVADSSRRRYITEEIKKLGKGNITAQTFTFGDLTTATNNFDHENLLGEGGFGRVYKGIIESTKQVYNDTIFHFICSFCANYKCSCVLYSFLFPFSSRLP